MQPFFSPVPRDKQSCFHLGPQMGACVPALPTPSRLWQECLSFFLCSVIPVFLSTNHVHHKKYKITPLTSPATTPPLVSTCSKTPRSKWSLRSLLTSSPLVLSSRGSRHAAAPNTPLKPGLSGSPRTAACQIHTADHIVPSPRLHSQSSSSLISEWHRVWLLPSSDTCFTRLPENHILTDFFTSTCPSLPVSFTDFSSFPLVKVAVPPNQCLALFPSPVR